MHIKLSGKRTLGSGLRRPECVLTTASGDNFVTDPRGVALVRADGTAQRISGKTLPEGFFPNGIALLPGRAFLIADLGPGGGIWHLAPDGHCEPYLMEVDGIKLPPTNFIGIDQIGRRWITVSTRLFPRERAAKPDWADGFIVMQDEHGARIVADGIGYTNEAIVNPNGDFLYVNETYGRCLSRYPIRTDSSLGPKEVVCQFSSGVFPDGLAYDINGNVWIVSVVSNRIIHVDVTTGRSSILFEDCDQTEINSVEKDFQTGGGDPIRRFSVGARRPSGNLASLAFGGPRLKTLYCGSLARTSLLCFDSSIAGAVRPHWQY